jgi:3-phenylpropionate/cinnamic acid dioxygenase small subunit
MTDVGAPALTAADRIELHELAARYCDLLDARDWPGLATVFTEDAVFDLTDVDAGTLEGLDAIRAFMDGTTHPLAHLITNIRVLDGEPVRLRSRVLAIAEDRRVRSGTYVDQVVRTAEGWRIRRRDFTRLRGPRARAAQA